VQCKTIVKSFNHRHLSSKWRLFLNYMEKCNALWLQYSLDKISSVLSLLLSVYTCVSLPMLLVISKNFALMRCQHYALQMKKRDDASWLHPCFCLFFIFEHNWHSLSKICCLLKKFRKNLAHESSQLYLKEKLWKLTAVNNVFDEIWLALENLPFNTSSIQKEALFLQVFNLVSQNRQKNKTCRWKVVGLCFRH